MVMSYSAYILQTQKKTLEKRQRRKESNTLYSGLPKSKKCYNVWKTPILIWLKLLICSSKNQLEFLHKFLNSYHIAAFYFIICILLSDTVRLSILSDTKMKHSFRHCKI